MDQANIRQRRPQQTEKIRGLQSHTQMYGKTEKKKKSYCGEKSVHGSREHLSICPVSQYYHVIFSFSDVFNQHGPIFFSPQGVSFESFSSISRTRLYSNAITREGTSIICIAQLFPFKALKDCNLKQTIDITDWFYLWKNILRASIIVMKSFFGSWVKRASIYVSHWQLHFVGTDYWMDGATLNKANNQPVWGLIEFSSS